MEDQDKQVLLEFVTQVGKMADGKHGVSFGIATSGVSTFSVALTPEFAEHVGPLLAKELADAAHQAKALDQQAHGLQVVGQLPDALRRKGH